MKQLQEGVPICGSERLKVDDTPRRRILKRQSAPFPL